MKIIWHIDPDDIEKVKAFYEQYRHDAFVKARIEKNLRDDKLPISQEDFWWCLVGCLLTSRQASGPGSAVHTILKTEPFPLDLQICKQQDDLAAFASAVLSDVRGLQYYNNIGKYLSANLSFLNSGGWEPTFQHLDAVRSNSSPSTERRAAEFLSDKLKGFGPKQSRALLQGLGISRYEVPFDSRLTRWLNSFGFPVKLTANALQDPNYYNFVSDGFQRLCETCEIMPCVLDAAIFTSYDHGRWTEENVV